MSYSYDVFGAIRTQTGSSGNYWLFTGEQRDGDSSMYYLRARYYDPAIGRFMGQDPVPFVNRYAYVGNNPINALDPLGLFCIGPDAICEKVEDVLMRPVNDIKASIDWIDTTIDHPGSVFQETVGFGLQRLSFGDRSRENGVTFYENCWGACSLLKPFGKRGITLGHNVFVIGPRDPRLDCHELKHVEQGDKYGLRFIPAYLLNPGKFEREAELAEKQCAAQGRPKE